MSIQTVTRISPVHMYSKEAFSNLLAPEHLGNPTKVEVCIVTDPRSGMKYRMETSFILEHKDSVNVALRCKQIPGMIPAINGNLIPNLSYIPNNSFYTLSIPKVISYGTPTQETQKETADSIKVHINLKDLEKKPKQLKHSKGKKKLIEPLLQYFIENECLICGFIALYDESKENSQKHMMSHIRHDEYVCDCCRKAFNSASELYKHKIDKTKKKPYVCEVCNKKFKRNHFLTSHIKTDHVKKNCQKKKRPKKNYIGQNFACTICHKRFHNFSSIRDHKRCHAGLEKFKCLLCSKHFFNTSIMRLHQHVFPADDDYKCKICKKKFTSYRKLEEHKRTHRRKQLFSCDICNKKFYLQAKLIEHSRLVHDIN